MTDHGEILCSHGRFGDDSNREYALALDVAFSSKSECKVDCVFNFLTTSEGQENRRKSKTRKERRADKKKRRGREQVGEKVDHDGITAHYAPASSGGTVHIAVWFYEFKM